MARSPSPLARALGVVLVLALSSSPLGGRSEPRASAQTDAVRRHEAEDVLNWALKAGPYPGISVAIEQHGKILYRNGVGWADIARKAPVTPETRFPVGSITKSFTCLSVLQLVAKGAVRLDHSAGDYLPDLPEPDRSVKITDLLTHMSGIPDYITLPNFPRHAPVHMTRQQVEGYFETRPLLFPSGSMFEYSNSDTYLLGLIIESVSGKSYDTYVRENILTPFGMERSGFDARDNGAPDRARGYRVGKAGFEPDSIYDFEVPFSAGALVTTPTDLLKYRKGVFGPKTSPTVRNLVLRQLRLSDGTPNPYALGCLVVTDMDGHRLITHSGDIWGFAADYAYYPDDDLTIAIAANSQDAAFPPVTIEHKLARIFLGLPQPDILDLALPAKVGESLAGDYQVGHIRYRVNSLTFVYRNGALNLDLGSAGGAPELLPLRYQGANRFVSSIDDEQQFKFTTEMDGSAQVAISSYDGIIAARRAAR